VAQVRAGAQHFAPTGRRGEPRGHGDDHHDAWTRNDDLPSVLPGGDHHVAGVAVVFRQLARQMPPPAETIAGKVVPFATVQPSSRLELNKVSVDFRQLLADAHVLDAVPPSTRGRPRKH